VLNIPDLAIPECRSPWRDDPELCPPDGFTFREAMNWFFTDSTDHAIRFFADDLSTSIPQIHSRVKKLLRDNPGGPALCDRLTAMMHDMSIMDAASRLSAIEGSSIFTRMSRIDEAAELRERVRGHQASIFMASYFLWYLYGFEPPGVPSPWRDQPSLPSVADLDPYKNMGMRISITARKTADGLNDALRELLHSTAPGMVPESYEDAWQKEMDSEYFGMTSLPRHSIESLARGYLMACVNHAIRPPENSRQAIPAMGEDPAGAVVQAFLEELSRHFRGSLAHRTLLTSWRRLDPPPASAQPPGDLAFRFTAEMQKALARNGRMPGDEIFLAQAAHHAMARVSVVLEKSSI
jgi:hypothetical protein